MQYLEFLETLRRKVTLYHIIFKTLGYSDKEYTEALDNGTYSRSDFINDHAGYGLCQWTHWVRKGNLYDYWKQNYPNDSIARMDMQLSFLNSEITESLRVDLENAKSIDEATELFMLRYEKPANQTRENIQKRIDISKSLYDEYIALTKEAYFGSNDEEEVVHEESKEDELFDILNSIKETLDNIQKILDKLNESYLLLTPEHKYGDLGELEEKYYANEQSK